jgi:hypothetical protein
MSKIMWEQNKFYGKDNLQMADYCPFRFLHKAVVLSVTEILSN